MKRSLKFMMLSCLCMTTLVLAACGGEDEPGNDPANNGGNTVETPDVFNNIQGLWMMVQETNLDTGETIALDGKSYRYCYIYSEDNETLYGQFISYPSMSKGTQIKIELDGDRILSKGEEIGTIKQCGKVNDSKIELVVEWVANQNIFNPRSYKCVGYYYRDTWSDI